MEAELGSLRTLGTSRRPWSETGPQFGREKLGVVPLMLLNIAPGVDLLPVAGGALTMNKEEIEDG